MLIDWFRLTAAFVLLVTPIALFHGKKVRLRHVASNWHGYLGQTFGLALHWIDFGRAYLGAWLLLESVSGPLDADGIPLITVALTQGAVTAVAVIVQCFVCKEVDCANAPFAFVTGVTVGLFPPLTALIPIVLALAVAAGTRAVSVYFPILAVALAGIGLLFEGKKAVFLLSASGVVILLAWLLPLMFQRELVVAYRPRRGSGHAPPDALR